MTFFTLSQALCANARAMSGIAASHLTTFVLWTFLPSFLSQLVLNVFYKTYPSRRPVLPPNASASQIAFQNSRAQAHARRARIILVAAYLAYTVLSTYFSQSYGAHPNFYVLVGLPRAVVEDQGAPAVKSHWRKLARVFHPDKIGKEGEARFVELRRAVECLEDERKRWAYERFGPVVLDWSKLVTPREFVVRGAQATVAFYVFAGLSILVLAFFRKEERGNAFWRYITLATTLAIEFSLILRATPSPLFSLLVPHRLPYEHIEILRQLFISSSMAFSQLTPLLFPPDPLEDDANDSEKFATARSMREAEMLRPLLQRLLELSALAEAEVIQLQTTELQPLLAATTADERGENEQQREERYERTVEMVKDKMCEIFDDLRIKGNAETNKVWTDAVVAGRTRQERRRQAPSPSLSPPAASKSLFPPPAQASISLPAAPKLDFLEMPASAAAEPDVKNEALGSHSVVSDPALEASNLLSAQVDKASEKVGVFGENEDDQLRLPTPPPESSSNNVFG